MRGTVSEGRWKITIADNGGGLSPELLKKINLQIGELMADPGAETERLGEEGGENDPMPIREREGISQAFLKAQPIPGGQEVMDGGGTNNFPSRLTCLRKTATIIPHRVTEHVCRHSRGSVPAQRYSMHLHTAKNRYFEILFNKLIFS